MNLLEKGEGYRKYLREMKEERIFEKRLVFYYLRNVFVLTSFLDPFIKTTFFFIGFKLELYIHQKSFHTLKGVLHTSSYTFF